MRKIKLIIIHCSATPNDRTLGPNPTVEIDKWHTERGFRRSPYWRKRFNPELTSIGYHYVISRTGNIYPGRHEAEVGAHVADWNAHSLGICLIGTDAFTAEQFATLKKLLTELGNKLQIPRAPPKLSGAHRILRPGVCGHRDIPGVQKSCPGFSVAEWLATWK